MNVLTDLQTWFANHCNGDWEHGYGIKITTIDNPGWALDVDLRETELADCELVCVKIDRSEDDWLWCWIEGGSFKARGGRLNLDEMIRSFLNMAQGNGRAVQPLD